MRTIKEIIESGKIYDYRNVEMHGVQILGGKIYDRKEKITFTLGTNEGGWEHVAISVGSGRKIPSWEIMCKAKTVFWRDDEDAVQLHPKESTYFHGFPKKMEVLHLWRPVDGDWSLLNKMFGADTQNHPVWIPVGDGLPDYGKVVLVMNDDGRMHTAMRDKDSINLHEWEIMYSPYDNDCWEPDEHGEITHWMPLPAGPLV